MIFKFFIIKTQNLELVFICGRYTQSEIHKLNSLLMSRYARVWLCKIKSFVVVKA